MPFTLIQAGSTLQLMDPSGNLATVTLPTGIVLNTTRKPRFAVFGRYVVLVNSPNRPITIDGLGTARVLAPRPPATIPVLSAQAGGTLTGSFYVCETFRIKDTVGNIIAESGFGPVSLQGVVAAQYLRADSLDLSSDDVSSSMLYRTTTGGAVTGPFFPWIELDGNTQTQIQDDLSDVGMSLITAPSLGSPADLTLIAEFRDRLWGVDRTNVDMLVYSEAESMYAWPAENALRVPKIGSDTRGVIALIARKEALGVGRRNAIRGVTGTKNANFSCINLTENIGVESNETVIVWRDTAYWLWKDGLYSWSANGFECVSDGIGGRGNVRSWFATDSYFNRAEFDQAFAVMIPERNVYRLFLCAAGSTTIDRFVDFDISSRIWFGPHKTAAFTPTCGITRPDSDDVLVPTVGGSAGFLWQEQATRSDGTSAIVLDVDTKRHDGGTPIVDKFWGNPAVTQVAQAAAGALVVTPSIGEMDATPATGNAQTVDCTLSVQSLARLGTGKFAKLNFYEDTLAQNVKLIGYELPHHELGVRI